jgi:GMP synthase (glutamine-hydrolysing)
VTEHPSALTDERERHYERLADRLEAAAGADVASVHYLDARDFGAADAVVLSGSFAPWAAHDPRALARLGDLVRGYGGPVLGICAGMQLQALFAGGRFAPAKEQPETGFGPVEIVEHGDLFRGLPPSVSVYKHHSEEIVALPDDFRVLATSAECAVEAISAPGRRWWGTQFHPEEFDPEHPAGERVLRNFFELAAR